MCDRCAGLVCDVGLVKSVRCGCVALVIFETLAHSAGLGAMLARLMLSATPDCLQILFSASDNLFLGLCWTTESSMLLFGGTKKGGWDGANKCEDTQFTQQPRML